MGYLFLSAALIVSLLIAMTAPRLGLILGGILTVTGLLPAVFVLISNLVFGAQIDESAGMLIMLWIYFASAPGVMLLVFSLLFIGMGL